MEFFRDAAGRYLEWVKEKRSEKFFREQERILNEHVLPSIGDEPMRRIPFILKESLMVLQHPAYKSRRDQNKYPPPAPGYMVRKVDDSVERKAALDVTAAVVKYARRTRQMLNTPVRMVRIAKRLPGSSRSDLGE